MGQSPGLAGAQVHLDDGRGAALADAHDQALAVRGESGGEGHAREIAHHLALAGVQAHQEHARLLAGVLQEGDFLGGGAEPRGQHQLAALAQQAHVGAVLVHEGQPLAAPVLGARLVDEGDLGVEVAPLAGQALVDLVGGAVGKAAPLVGVRGEALADQLARRSTS